MAQIKILHFLLLGKVLLPVHVLSPFDINVAKYPSSQEYSKNIIICK